MAIASLTSRGHARTLYRAARRRGRGVPVAVAATAVFALAVLVASALVVLAGIGWVATFEPGGPDLFSRTVA